MKTTYRPLFSAWAVAAAELQDRMRMLDEARRAGLQVEGRESQVERALLESCQTEEREMENGH
jgi:hypothetical protein